MCASVAWNTSFDPKDKDVRLRKCRTLKSSCTNVVKFRLCERDVHWCILIPSTKISGCAAVEMWNQVVLM